jgi:hypothetical protein
LGLGTRDWRLQAPGPSPQALTQKDYEYVRRANVEQAQWDVPTVNVLGAIDDGKGHWALGWDDKHPQASGHAEFAYSFVPSLAADGCGVQSWWNR